MVNGGGSHVRAKRDVIRGWSTHAARRHIRWLYSVNVDRLDGYGIALTLTVRDCPPDGLTFTRLREAFIKRLRGHDAGLVRIHWVTEWQARGVPHLHSAVYFRRPLSVVERASLLSMWCEVASGYGASFGGQHGAVIDGPVGWLKYLAKHAARGVRHYQRQTAPAGWESTGRLWGHGGEWPAEEPLTFSMTDQAFYRYRRLLRAWLIAEARTSGDARRIAYARRMLRGPADTARFRGVSEWIPQETTIRFMDLLVSEGYAIMSV